MKIGNLNWNAPLALAAKDKAAATRKPDESDPRLRRLRDMQEGLERLRALPTPEQSAKQAAKEKAARLKQRLQELKAMLLHASPKEAKALARELKSIAKELASVAKGLGASGGESGASGGEADSAAVEPAAGQDAAREGSSGEVASAATAAADPGEKAEGTSDTPPVGTRDGNSEQRRSTPEGDDSDLRTVLQEAQKLLKQVISMLKAKLAVADRESRENVEAAEKSLADLGQALAAGAGDNFYTPLGGLEGSAALDGGLASMAVSGTNINANA